MSFVFFAVWSSSSLTLLMVGPVWLRTYFLLEHPTERPTLRVAATERTRTLFMEKSSLALFVPAAGSVRRPVFYSRSRHERFGLRKSTPSANVQGDILTARPLFSVA